MSDAGPSRRPGRGLKWALGLSLALNLIIIGFMAGAVWRFAGPDAPQRHWREGANYGTPYVRALPPQERRALLRSLRRNADSLPTRAERRALHEELFAALRAEDFDPAAVEAIFAVQGNTARQVLTRAQTGWLEIVGGMTAAERAAVADRLEAALRRGPGGRKPKP